MMEDGMKSYFSRGKLMLAGEYAVLNMSKSLVFPLKCGQTLDVTFNADGPHEVLWKTIVGEKDYKEYNLPIADINQKRYRPEGERGYLLRLLRMARKINANFLHQKGLYIVETSFLGGLMPGLGTSSSLISNVAYWAQVDPYRLNRMVSKGSGYDVAAARSNSPISFVKDCSLPKTEKVNIDESILNAFFLVHLNKKENTEKSISLYLKLLRTKKAVSAAISSIIDQMISTKELDKFGLLMEEHDEILSKVLRRETVKVKYFSDFKGWIKSSGAWGGDFILVLSKMEEKDIKAYFSSKGFKKVIKLKELIQYGE